ncbi:hypothetical protein [Streptomyces sp. NPDC096068]|uniref:hypothetical protein n=1 Tax=Streptomyces sp. NPDC096068 TaxID=3155424 RepID=UPI00333106EB
MSPRTCQRRISELMQEIGARTRLQVRTSPVRRARRAPPVPRPGAGSPSRRGGCRPGGRARRAR